MPDAIRHGLPRQRRVQVAAERRTAQLVRAVPLVPDRRAGGVEATALELVIKAREAAYVPIDALHAEQFLHGPMVAFNEGDLLIAITTPGNAYDRVAGICAVADAMGGDDPGIPVEDVLTIPVRFELR